MHGSNTKNLSVSLSLCQASKNDMSFLLSPMFSLQQNLRTRGWNRFSLEVGWGGSVGTARSGEGAQTMYTHM
jgi:hypothetical protein